MKTFSLSFIFVFCALCGEPSICFAFDQGQVQSVLERTKAQNMRAGLRFGAVDVIPSLQVAQLYDDNVYRQSTKKGDAVSVFRPQVMASTDWSLHELRVGASAQLGRFAEYSSENYTDWSYHAAGRYDFGYKTFALVQAKVKHEHEDRGALDDVGGDAPIEYEARQGSVQFKRVLGIVKLSATGMIEDFTYEDSNRGGSAIDNSGRNRTHASVGGQLVYTLSDRSDAYLSGRWEERQYDLDSAAFRDSTSVRLRGGVKVNITGKVEGDFYLGHVAHSFDSGFSDINQIDFGGHLLWNISQISSFRAAMDRNIVETTLSGSSSIVRTEASLGVEHALKDHIIMQGTLGVRDDTYKGQAISATRDNITYFAKGEARYFLNNYVAMGASYAYSDRDYKGVRPDYDHHKMALSVAFSF